MVPNTVSIITAYEGYPGKNAKNPLLSRKVKGNANASAIAPNLRLVLANWTKTAPKIAGIRYVCSPILATSGRALKIVAPTIAPKVNMVVLTMIDAAMPNVAIIAPSSVPGSTPAAFWDTAAHGSLKLDILPARNDM